MKFPNWCAAEKERCPGSGKPTRTDGSCDRCFATNVAGEERSAAEVAQNFAKHLSGELFAASFSLTYSVAIDHAYVESPQPPTAVQACADTELPADRRDPAPP